MHNVQKIACYIALLTAPVFLTSPARANDDVSLQIMQEGSIAYVSGGVGDEERTALEATRGEYNLHILNSTTSGAFSGDAMITIFDRTHHELLTAEIEGPLFFAHLPAGHYIVKATNDGQTQKQAVTIASGKPTSIHFAWKSNS